MKYGSQLALTVISRASKDAERRSHLRQTYREDSAATPCIDTDAKSNTLQQSKKSCNIEDRTEENES
jgi:hypothetical protein